jgi:hypothetical protein
MKLGGYPRPSLEFLLSQSPIQTRDKENLEEAYGTLSSLLPYPQQKDDDTLLSLLPRFCFLKKPEAMLEKLLSYLCHKAGVARGYLHCEFLKEYQGDGYRYACVLLHGFLSFLFHHEGIDLSAYGDGEAEILIDLLAIYLGYGKILLMGYYPRPDQEHPDLFDYQDSKLGALSVEEIAYVERRYVLVTDARIR